MTLHDTLIEEVVLGTFINSPLTYKECNEIISEDCFFDPFNKTLFSIIKKIVAEGNLPELSMIRHEVKDDFAKVVSIALKGEYGTQFKHCQYLYELSVRRKLQELGVYMTTNSTNAEMDIADITKTIHDSVGSIFNFNSNCIFTLKEAVSNVFKQAEINATSDSRITGTATGFSEYDRRSGGLQSSDLIIVAGETSHGKTSLAVSIMRNASYTGCKIAMYSLEMKKEQIAARLMSIESGIPSNVIQYSKLSIDQFGKLDHNVSRLNNAPIFFDDRSTSNIDIIISSIQTMKAKQDIDGAIVDYLQILNVNMKGANKEQQMGDVARRLKNLAKDLDIWIIALSQLNRDTNNPVPNLNRLRDSGQIAEAADVVMFVYRPEIYGRDFPQPFMDKSTFGTALINVAKGRNIGMMQFLLRFDKETTHFYEDEIPVSTNFINQPF